MSIFSDWGFDLACLQMYPSLPSPPPYFPPYGKNVFPRKAREGRGGTSAVHMLVLIQYFN